MTTDAADPTRLEAAAQIHGDCRHSWCQARACDCAYASVQPHSRAGCRYASDAHDDDAAGDGGR